MPASQFYSGLVAELYDPLVGESARPEDYTPFLDRAGTPALELACGTGRPLLDLLAQGYAVEGLDASPDMLAVCRARAAERGLEPTLHLGEMQSFRLDARYASIFLAGASFTLLTTDADAARALACMHAHLQQGGSALVPLEIEDAEVLRRGVGWHREVPEASGDRLRVTLVDVETRDGGRNLLQRLRYERIPEQGEVASLERTWERRSWTIEQFDELARGAGFERPSFRAPTGGPAEPDASVFVALLRRS